MANARGREPPTSLPLAMLEDGPSGRSSRRPRRVAIFGGALAFGLGLAGGTGVAFLGDGRLRPIPPPAPVSVPEPADSTSALVRVEAPLVVDHPGTPTASERMLEVAAPAAAATVEGLPAQAAATTPSVKPDLPARAAGAAPSTSLRDRLSAIRRSIEASRASPPRPEAR